MLYTEFISQTYIYLLIGLFTLFILSVFIFLFYALNYKRSLRLYEENQAHIEENKDDDLNKK